MNEAVPPPLSTEPPALGAPVAAPSLITTELQRLAPQVLVLWLVSGVITLVVVGAVVGVMETLWLGRSGWFLALGLPRWTVTAVAAGLFGVIPLVMAPLQYRRWSYAIRERDVLIESGVVWRVRRSIPRARVQHVDIRSGPIDRMLGVVEVALHTAGSVGAVASIPGLSPESAERLREALVGEAHDGL